MTTLLVYMLLIGMSSGLLEEQFINGVLTCWVDKAFSAFSLFCAFPLRLLMNGPLTTHRVKPSDSLINVPKKAIVNIGATSPGIGAVYALAKDMGFETTGIVSTQAKEQKVEISPHVDRVFYVADDSWGGLKENTQILTATSATLVQCSDIVVGIGGGRVARDEMIAARREGKTIKYIPADMHHEAAINKARMMGLSIPTNFRGAAFSVFGNPVESSQGK